MIKSVLTTVNKEFQQSIYDVGCPFVKSYDSHTRSCKKEINSISFSYYITIFTCGVRYHNSIIS